MFIKTKACAIMQPTYLPWLGYFDLIANTKDFLFLDNVKFNKSSYHHQNKILGANSTVLLSVPTHAKKGRMNTMIHEVEIDDSTRWRKKHLMSIEQSYKKAPYYDEIYQYIEGIISSDIKNLSELNIKLIKLFTSMLSLNTKFHIASHIESLAEDKVQRLIDFCQLQNCNYYYSPAGSLNYLDTTENKALFNSAGIAVYFQQFELIPYQQKHKKFAPYMSILDSLMYCGSEGTKDILKKGYHVLEFK